MTPRPRPGRSAAVAALVLCAATALAGCSSAGSGSDAAPAPRTSSPPTPTLEPSTPAQIATSYCERVLPLADVTALAGHEMGSVTVVPVDGTQGCTWSSSDDSRTTVQAVNASSSTWAAQLPQIAASLQSLGVTIDARLTADLASAATTVAGGSEVDADLACTIFTELAEASGYDDGVSATIRSAPSAEQPTSIVGQGCSSDEYSFVQLNAPDLAGDLENHLADVRAALRQVHGAPLTF